MMKKAIRPLLGFAAFALTQACSTTASTQSADVTGSIRESLKTAGIL